MPPEDKPMGWPELREVVGRTGRRIQENGLLGDAKFPAGWEDHVTNHLYHGKSEGSPFDGTPLAEQGVWRTALMAGDPMFDTNEIADKDFRNLVSGSRAELKDLQSWPGMHWTKGQKKRYQEDAFLGKALGRQPGAWELSPGAQQAYQWHRDRRLLEGILDSRAEGNSPTRSALGTHEALQWYNRSKNATHVRDPYSWQSNFQKHAIFPGAHSMSLQVGPGMNDVLRDNANPLGYLNNNIFAPFQKAVYDTAMENPQQLLRVPDHDDIEKHGISGDAVVAAENFNWLFSPVVGFARNAGSFGDNLIHALDAYQNGSAAFRASPDIQLDSSGMDSVKELQRIRGNVEQAQETMPHRLYHHRNTGEFPTAEGDTIATIASDMATDPSVFFRAGLLPVSSMMHMRAAKTAAAGKKAYDAVSPLRSLLGEAGEEAAWGGPMNLLSQMVSGAQPMTHEQAQQAGEAYWPEHRAAQLRAEEDIRHYGMRNGILKGLMP